MELQAVKFNPDSSEFELKTDYLKMLYNKLQSLYGKIGYKEPWVGYFALIHGEIVGSCGFKNYPNEKNTVEIAYITLPEFEKKGYASEMCKQLIDLSLNADSSVIITAQTLKTNIASHKILLKNHFVQSGTLIDDDYGEILEWTYSK